MKNTILIGTITIITLFSSINSKAQSLDDIFNASHNIFSEEDNNITGSNIKSAKMTLTKVYLAGPPIELGKLRVKYNTEYKRFHNDFTSINNQNILFVENLHDIRLTTIFNYKLNNKWAFNYVNLTKC
jgi:hypothetical protein